MTNATPQAAAIAVAALLCASSAQAQTTIQLYTPPENQNISGVWWTDSYSPEIQLAERNEIRLTAEGSRLHAENRAALEADPLSDEARKFCTADGVPRIWASPYPFEILQTGGYVTILYELNRVVRRIKMDAPMPDADTLRYYPFYSGHSVGHWEGDTLIVETAGYNGKTYLDATGLPHTADMRTVERIAKSDDGRLNVQVTVTDPTIFEEPFTAEYTFDPQDIRLQDYTCGKPHRDISHIEGVNPPGGQP
jgi:hypothetical protein